MGHPPAGVHRRQPRGCLVAQRDHGVGAQRPNGVNELLEVGPSKYSLTVYSSSGWSSTACWQVTCASSMLAAAAAYCRNRWRLTPSSSCSSVCKSSTTTVRASDWPRATTQQGREGRRSAAASC